MYDNKQMDPNGAGGTAVDTAVLYPDPLFKADAFLPLCVSGNIGC